ncbi:MAG: glycerate kinase [Dehalococcoidales bacterium]|nr:glycerate kinase [Dehalococcoidales bacterium]
MTIDSKMIEGWRYGQEHDPAGHRKQAMLALAAALQAVDPAQAVRNFLRADGDTLFVGDESYDLRRFRRIYVIGGGKASVAMGQAVEEVLDDRITAGLINTKYGYTAPLRRIDVNEAGHPLPDENGMAGGKRMLELAREADEDTLILCLISGGGSALLVSPVEDITLADKQALTNALLRCGATINEVNSLRKHLSQMKGGNLARAAYPATVVSLLLSDVVGNPLDVIGSGPTVPDTSTFRDAYGVLERYGIVDQVPASVVSHLRRGLANEIPDTPKPGDPIFKNVQNLLVASNEIASEAAVAKARELGFNTLFLTNLIEGEAREVAKVMSALAREVSRSGLPVPRPACIIAGGETTVTVRGHGVGGRNQELSLAAALKIDGLDDVAVISLATDGSDGPTDASGAVADGRTVKRARAAGLNPWDYLAENDSYHFFEKLGDLLITGPTNTNVNDLVFVFAF